MGLGAAPRLAYHDGVKLLAEGGWRDIEKLLEMSCTVMAESGWYPHAFHWNDPAVGENGSTDWGLFQLNDGNVGGSAPALTSSGDPIPTNGAQASALIPAEAVVTARKLYNARGFEPWFGHGIWRSYAPQMTRAMANYLRAELGIPLL